MARMNYSRPNGGYERQAWARPYDGAWLKRRNTSTKQKLKEHATHQADVRPHNRGWALWCCECNCNIRYLTGDEIKAYQTTKN